MSIQRSLSRRQILKGFALATATVTLPMVGTVACSRPSSGTGGGTGTSRITIAVSSTAASLDREDEIGAAGLEAIVNLYEPLTEFSRRPLPDSDGAFVPVFDTTSWELRLLAEQPTVSEDGLTWTLKMRPGVKSHAGNELTATDMAYAFDRHQALWALGSFYHFVAGLLPRERKAWTVVDDRTIEVTTQKPSPLFEMLLQNNPALGPFDSKAAKAQGTSEDPWSTAWIGANGEAGHGPYTIEEHVPGQRTVFRAFPDYYRGKPKIDTVVQRQIDASSTRVSLLRAGEVDIVRDLLPVEYESLEGVEGIAVDNFDQSRFLVLFMMMNNKAEPFNNPLVRQAISWTVPYQEVVAVYRGYASEWRGVISRDYPMFDPNAWLYGDGADPAKGRDLMAQAGLAGGFSSQLMYNSSEAVSEQVAVVLQSSLREIGIQLELVKFAAAAFTENLTNENFKAAVYQDLAITPDIGYTSYLWYRSDAFSNFTQYESAEADALIDSILTTMDPTARAATASQLQRKIIEDAPSIFLAQPHYVVARRQSVRGITGHTLRVIRFEELEVADEPR